MRTISTNIASVIKKIVISENRLSELTEIIHYNEMKCVVFLQNHTKDVCNIHAVHYLKFQSCSRKISNGMGKKTTMGNQVFNY